MILAEKVVSLRKKEGWSQEELADKLGISRQSVSKWESGASIPDIDKILLMSSLFGVSTDYLLKDELEEAVFSENKAEKTGEGRSVSVEEANAFMDLSRKLAAPMALAIALFILCPVPLILLGGLAEYGRTLLTEDMAGGLGAGILLIIVAIGVAIVISCGLQLEKYEYLEKEAIFLQYGVQGIVEKKKEMFAGVFRICTLIGVVLCILAVLPVLIAGAVKAGELQLVCCVDILLVVIAVAVYLFVWAGTIQNSFQKLLQQEDYTPERKSASQKTGHLAGAYWCVVTAVFLIAVVCAKFMEWEHFSNAILGLYWAVAGLLFAALAAIVKAVSGRNSDSQQK